MIEEKTDITFCFFWFYSFYRKLAFNTHMTTTRRQMKHVVSFSSFIFFLQPNWPLVAEKREWNTGEHNLTELM